MERKGKARSLDGEAGLPPRAEKRPKERPRQALKEPRQRRAGAWTAALARRGGALDAMERRPWLRGERRLSRQGGARPRAREGLARRLETRAGAGEGDDLSLRLVAQPLSSPDVNVDDLALSRSIKARATRRESRRLSTAEKTRRARGSQASSQGESRERVGAPL